MATIILTGLVKEIKSLDKSTYIKLVESTGTKDKPHYNYYDCIAQLTENQLQHIFPDKIIEIVGELNIKEVSKDGKTYHNANIYIYNLKFKGEYKRNEKDL